jgi:hypothetical protein
MNSAVHKRRHPRVFVLDMDSSESPTYGAQEGSAYNGHFGSTCYIRCSCSTSLAISSGAPCARATCTDEIIAAGDQRFHRRSHEELFEKQADRSLKHAGFDASNCGVPQNRRTRGDIREIRYIYS